MYPGKKFVFVVLVSFVLAFMAGCSGVASVASLCAALLAAVGLWLALRPRKRAGRSPSLPAQYGLLLRPDMVDRFLRVPLDVSAILRLGRIEYLLISMFIVSSVSEANERIEHRKELLELKTTAFKVGLGSAEHLTAAQRELHQLAIHRPDIVGAAVGAYYLLFVMLAVVWIWRRRTVIDELTVRLTKIVGGPLVALTSEYIRSQGRGALVVDTTLSEWRPSIVRLMRGATCAFVHLGPSEAVAWEVSVIVRYGDSRRIMMLTDSMVPMSAGEWEHLIAQYSPERWRLALPASYPGPGVLITFDETGTVPQVHQPADVLAVVRDQLSGLPPSERLILGEPPEREIRALMAKDVEEARTNASDVEDNVFPLWRRVASQMYADTQGFVAILIAASMAIAGFMIAVRIFDDASVRFSDHWFGLSLMLFLPIPVYITYLVRAEAMYRRTGIEELDDEGLSVAPIFIHAVFTLAFSDFVIACVSENEGVMLRFLSIAACGALAGVLASRGRFWFAASLCLVLSLYHLFSIVWLMAMVVFVVNAARSRT